MATPDQFGSNYEKFATQVNFKDSNGKTHNLRIQVNFQPATGAAESSFPDVVVGPAVAKGETLSTSTQLGGFKTSYNNTTIDTFLLNRGVTVDPTTRQNFKVALQNQTNRTRYNRVSAQYPQLKSGFSQANGSTLYIPGTQNSPATAPPAGTPGSQPPLAPDPTTAPDPMVSQIGGNTTTLTKYEKEKTAISKNYSTLIYPRDHGDSPYDFIQILPIEYVPGFRVGEIPSVTIERVENRFSYKQTGTQIFLPMTPGISESNSVGWGADELNPIQLAFGQVANNAIARAGSSGGASISAIQNFFQDLLKAGGGIISNPQLKTAVASYFAGQAVGANFLGRSGIVLNPNLELLFQGPKLRSFRYNFRFTPRDPEEAEIVRAIIKVFKKTMAVKQTPGSLFLGTPSVYELKYIYNSGVDHPFLNKIKPCALTTFNVNYTPDGSYMTYQDGSMTSYTVDMQFDEIEPIYDEDIDDVDSATMGY